MFRLFCHLWEGGALDPPLTAITAGRQLWALHRMFFLLIFRHCVNAAVAVIPPPRHVSPLGFVTMPIHVFFTLLDSPLLQVGSFELHVCSAHLSSLPLFVSPMGGRGPRSSTDCNCSR